MKKKISKVILASFFVCSFVGVSQAGSTSYCPEKPGGVCATYTDIFKYGGELSKNKKEGAVRGVDWEFDITDSGYNPVLQRVVSATVKFFFKDSPYDKNDENAKFSYTGPYNHKEWYPIGKEIDTGWTKDYELTTLNWVQDGKTKFHLDATQGDFIFSKAIFTAGATCPPAPVPEPATMLLLGAGIAGIAGSRLRKKKK